MRSGWFESYVETVVERDIAALADIRRLAALAPLLRWTAAQTSQELNLAAASRRLAISQPTVVSYLDWLRTVFLIQELPAWSRNLSARAIRRPKLHIADTGLAAHLLGIGPDALLAPMSQTLGPPTTQYRPSVDPVGSTTTSGTEAGTGCRRSGSCTKGRSCG
ncbi:DUF4143 domain-containing protein [Candidatus Poriferisodalis sp.]|uniref:DUF4143 domain-containing protein n=1 Tax=Candidatus Poriferisodalis sp. TaxID=3101277 RepID=UPI003C6EB101